MHKPTLGHALTRIEVAMERLEDTWPLTDSTVRLFQEEVRNALLLIDIALDNDDDA